MGFFIAMFLCNLLMPSIMVIAGYCMYKNPPKEINGLIGYRTAMSEKNKDTWAFAHDCCGNTNCCNCATGNTQGDSHRAVVARRG